MGFSLQCDNNAKQLIRNIVYVDHCSLIYFLNYFIDRQKIYLYSVCLPGTMKCSSRESPTEADLTASPPRWVTDMVTVGDSTRPSSTRAGWISPFTSRSRPLLQGGGGG
jgi:hypothetical protein